MVTAVATIGCWTMLSILIIHLEFCFLEVNEWEVPTPTAVMSIKVGLVFNAFSADVASCNLLSSFLTANTVEGSLSVTPTPGIDWDAISIADVVPVPVYLYSSSSPVTKKWLGIITLSVIVLTTVEAPPTKSLLNIGFSLWVSSNDLLTSVSVAV